MVRKVLLGVLLVAGFVFAAWFCLLENPLLEENTASLIGVRYPVQFVVFSTLNGASFCLGALAMYRKYNFRSRLGTICALTAPVMLLVTLLTQGDLVDGEITFSGTTKVIHWTATILFILGVVASLALLFFMLRKRVRGFTALCAITLSIVIGMIVTILTIGKSGLFEAVPIWLMYILLFLVNCTNLFPLRKLEDA